jgi:stage II sporulation protein D
MTRLKIAILLFLAMVPRFFTLAFAAVDPLIAEYNRGKFNDAVKGYRAAAQDGSLQASLDLAVVLKDLGDYDEAAFVLRRCRERSGAQPALLSLLARLYYLNGNNRQALSAAEELITLAPDDRDAHIIAGLCREALGSTEQARQSYEKALSLDKYSVVARLSLAQLYYRHNRLAESAENFSKVNILDASIVAVYGWWADALYRLGNYRDAFRIYEKMVLMDPANMSVRKKVEVTRQKLGNDFFKTQHAKTEESRKGKSLLLRPALTAPAMKQVAVGILTGFRGTLKFKCPVPFVITDHKGVAVECRPNELYQIGSGEGRVSVTDATGNIVAGSSRFLIRPSSPEGCLMFFSVKTGGGDFWAGFQDRSFRGTIEIRADGAGSRGLDMINRVSLEEYLYSVVPSEMPPTWPMEALEAQAVAARSEAVCKLGRHKAGGFDFCAGVHCQAYYGVENETEITRQAVDQTSGIIMTSAGKPVDAIYSSTCGGHTQDNIFGDGRTVSYLKGIPDMDNPGVFSFPLSPYDLELWLRSPPKGILCDIPDYLNSSNFRWVRMYSADELKQMVDKIRPVGDILRIMVTRRNKSGHVEAVRIKGGLSSMVLEKELAIRQALGGLKSGMFKVEVKYGVNRLPEQFIFYGGGWGHGVGLCQAGACGLALRGRTYRQILLHYFNGVDFEKLY